MHPIDDPASPEPRCYYPPAGRGLGPQSVQAPRDVGLRADLVERLRLYLGAHALAGPALAGHAPRWALWRHGHLVHVEGDLDATVDVASLRKTWHAMIVGAAIHQGRIPSYDQRLSEWLGELDGSRNPHEPDATWWHVMTQSAAFDYPYGPHPAYRPGEMWTYSDWSLVHLCNALARVYGKRDFCDTYDEVARKAYFRAIGMVGWSTVLRYDPISRMVDGVRFALSLEHMGRLGLLALSRGRWEGRELVPAWFVGELETKRTRGMRVNYRGPNDGVVGLDPARFPECPYGYLTWVNTDGDYYPGASTAWAWGSGAGGTKTMWNGPLGVVFAAAGLDEGPSSTGVVHLIEEGIAGRNPLAAP